MSNAKFCHNCGKELSVAFKFCPVCGTNLASLAPPPSQNPPQTFTPFSPKRDDDDEEDNKYDRMEHLPRPTINKLEFDLRTYNVPKETVANVMSQQISSEELNYKRVSPTTKRLSAEEVKNDFQKEAGTLRKNG